jgi:hypothetical protein
MIGNTHVPDVAARYGDATVGKVARPHAYGWQMVCDGAGKVSGSAAHVDDTWRGGTGGANRIECRIAEKLGLLTGCECALGDNELDTHEHFMADHVSERCSRGTTLRHGACGGCVIGLR